PMWCDTDGTRSSADESIRSNAYHGPMDIRGAHDHHALMVVRFGFGGVHDLWHGTGTGKKSTIPSWQLVGRLLVLPSPSRCPCQYGGRRSRVRRREATGLRQSGDGMRYRDVTVCMYSSASSDHGAGLG